MFRDYCRAKVTSDVMVMSGVAIDLVDVRILGQTVLAFLRAAHFVMDNDERQAVEVTEIGDNIILT